MTENLSYDVHIWGIEKTAGKRVVSHTARWKVASRRFSRTFRSNPLAEGFRSDLIVAARRGEPFDRTTGLPQSLTRRERQISWYEFACKYVDHKWPHIAANSRRSIAESMTAATLALVLPGRTGRPSTIVARRALREWAFNSSRRSGVDIPPEIEATLRWFRDNTIDVGALDDVSVVRKLLDSLGKTLSGKRASGNYYRRRRAVVFNALEYAVLDLKLLQKNPLSNVKPSINIASSRELVDRRSVINPDQARKLLEAVGSVQPSGPRLKAFFAVLYFSALRPEEAVELRRENLLLPPQEAHDQWGRLVLSVARPDVGAAWTDTNERRDRRSLKHRVDDESRPVPCPPELTRMLREHLEQFAPTSTGLVFTGPYGGLLSASTYSRIWGLARKAALSPQQVASPLARRPYDLRHAAVSTWLNAGVPPTQVAEWAGHSVDVLLRVYAKCLDGQERIALRRVQEALAGGAE